MRITERKNQDIMVLELDGRLITDEGAELLRDRILTLLFQGQSKIVLNLSRVPHVDSCALGELVRCVVTARNGNSSIKLSCLTERLREVLTNTRLIAVFDTYDTEEAALQSFMAAA